MPQKVIIGIFAHPDDESFGPSGFLALQIKEGADVHLICTTAGQAGVNPDNHPNLGELRSKEWYEAGKLLGASSQYQLGYEDGKLSNSVFREVAAKIEEHIIKLTKNYETGAEFKLLTMDHNGITGHIDHIVMSFVTCFVFERLRRKDNRFESVLLYCASQSEIPNVDTSFVFMPKGKADNEIDLKVDIAEVFEQKKQVMRAHNSQRGDCEWLIAEFEKSPAKCECFCEYKG